MRQRKVIQLNHGFLQLANIKLVQCGKFKTHLLFKTFPYLVNELNQVQFSFGASLYKGTLLCRNLPSQNPMFSLIPWLLKSPTNP